MKKYLLATALTVVAATAANATDAIIAQPAPVVTQTYYTTPGTVYVAAQPVYYTYPRYERVRDNYDWGYWNEGERDATDVKTPAEHHAGDPLRAGRERN